MTRNRIKKQSGFIVTMELLVLSAILVLGLIVGMVDVRDSMLAELGDLSESIGALNQAYTIDGVSNAANTAATSGSQWLDAEDNAGLTGAIDATDNASGDAGWGDVQFTAALPDESTNEPSLVLP
jgi:hypothetical protein